MEQRKWLITNDKTPYVILIRSELLKWTMPHFCHWIRTIINQGIKQGSPNDWQASRVSISCY